MDTNESKDHADHVDWLPCLPEFDIDSRIYFDDPESTHAQGGTSLHEQAEPQPTEALGFTTCDNSTRSEESLLVDCSEGLHRYAIGPALDDAAGHLLSQRDHPMLPSSHVTQVSTPTNDLHCYNQGFESPHQSSSASGDISDGVLETATVTTHPTSIGTPNMMIGKVYRTTRPDIYVFRCDHHKCSKKTFSRWYDFRRHYNGAHARLPVVHWCDHRGCPRSKATGDRPFPRKDKLKDHIESVHR